MNQIMSLTGLSFTAAGTVLAYLNVATFLGLLLSLTGIGAAAGATIMAYRATILATKAAAGRAAAISL
ncbi:hypothetical protein SAMN05216238_107131 [Lentibacillus persicus]|uniref:Uncharacterized protein n=1 Tax=Lentibacillus persicus TaxID=640948 RepID=A0A1I1X706_9BACI|nr:hypothetical protein [Lentibacillus persicus]SFE03159.1 hypothetical protein SAMN05216238_107131 [Lentibacillus persicus]